MNASPGRKGILGSGEERIARASLSIVFQKLENILEECSGPISVPRAEEADEATCLSNLVAQKNASALFAKSDKIHQILRELAVGIFCPSISSDMNYHHRTSCQLPPAYIDTKMRQILIRVDYMVEVWGIYTQREMCRFAGLIDIFTKHDFEGTCDENTNEDPIYNPNSTGKKKVSFMQYADNMLFKLTLSTTQLELHENVFRFDAVCSPTVTCQSAAEVSSSAKGSEETTGKNHSYLAECRVPQVNKLIPFLLGFKKKMEIPNVSKRLQPYSSKKTVTLLLIKCQCFQYAQNEYFYVHRGTEFDVSTPSVKDISLKIMILVCCLSYNVHMCMSLQLIKYERTLYVVKISIRDKEKTILSPGVNRFASCPASGYKAQLFDMDMPGREYYPIPVMEFDGKR
ncbi:LOW QUALITY PROTEIN: ankyrin and armadillo repeat-containing protein [Theristicus caerulescens]